MVRKYSMTAILGLIALLSLPQLPAARQPKSEELISVKDFGVGARNVKGFLGHPLGTVVRVTGTIIIGDATGPKANAGKTLLRIETVNGQRVEPLFFPFTRAAQGISEPAAGVQFDYFVHEFGSFDGTITPPKELGIEDPEVAHDGFGYRPEICIHKSN